jgi:hypothetical protein
MVWPLIAARDLFFNEGSYLHKTGWVESLICWEPLSQGGDSVPWMSYQAIAFLDERLNSDTSLFEYGSGFSKKFYAQRVRSVTSVEYDAEWHKKVGEMIPGNVTIPHRPLEPPRVYEEAIAELPTDFDVVVDGRNRVRCLINSLRKVNAAGVIVLDDSERPKYREGIEAEIGGIQNPSFSWSLTDQR